MYVYLVKEDTIKFWKWITKNFVILP